MPGESSGIPTATVHAHRGVEEAIDRAFLEAIQASAKARTYMSFPRGPAREAFLTLHEPIVELFELTSDLADLKLDDCLRADMLRWINARTSQHLSKEQTLRLLGWGLGLFADYKAALLQKGIVSIHRKG